MEIWDLYNKEGEKTGETVGYIGVDLNGFRDFLNRDKVIPTQKERYKEYYIKSGLL